MLWNFTISTTPLILIVATRFTPKIANTYPALQIEPILVAARRAKRQSAKLKQNIRLCAMMEASAKESRAQHKRFLIETVLSVIAIVVASIAAIASVAVLNPALANALRELIS